MFDNIGRKIKSLASILCWIGIIAWIICGICIVLINKRLIAVGFLVMLLGPITSWLASFLLYGFGELIDKTDEIAKNTAAYLPRPKASAQSEEARVRQKKVCTGCGNEIEPDAKFCVVCGKEVRNVL